MRDPKHHSAPGRWFAFLFPAHILASVGRGLFLAERPVVEPRGRLSYMKSIETASVKLLVVDGFASRYQHWKFQVSPAMAATLPFG